MANFAELNESSIVSRVLVVGNEVTTIDGVEVEQRGIDFLNDIFPESGTWVQTSMWTIGGVHNGVDGEPDGGTALRGTFAGIGYTYDSANDIFHRSEQPYPSWTLNTTTAEWEAPSARVTGYVWDEDTLAWVKPDPPFASWVTWDDESGGWEAPVTNPNTGDPPFYWWDEDTTSWIEVEAS